MVAAKPLVLPTGALPLTEKLARLRVNCLVVALDLKRAVFCCLGAEHEAGWY